MTGLGLLFLVVFAGAYLTARSVSRELAVARLQSDFVSAVSHEFRTPLTSLRQFTTLLKEDDNLSAVKRHEFYDAQSRAGRRLAHLVESLLDFGRMEAGAHPYCMRRVSAAAVVAATVGEFRTEALVAGFTLEYSSDVGPAWVRADTEALSRAVRNLLENAQKYSGDARRIVVHVGHQHRSIAISVGDFGLGIPRHEQRQIFNKFVRGSASRAYGIKGTGIGLAMVRHIVSAHGGQVTVVSEPGRGSTFTMRLPAARHEARAMTVLKA
jgi:signal transduction histidine kinase